MKTNIMLGLLVAICHAPTANATVIQPGAAYAIADNFVDHGGTPGTRDEGSHFHASNVPPDDPANSTVVAEDVAEVGGFFGTESIRGLVEFDLTGKTAADSATLAFDVANLLERELNSFPVGGLYGQPKYVGGIDVLAYAGNNSEDDGDYQASAIAQVGSFQTDNLSAGDTTLFDITQVYNEHIAAGGSSLGIRLQISSANVIPENAISFDNFQLTVVPEPSSLVLASLALLVLLGNGYRYRSPVAS